MNNSQTMTIQDIVLISIVIITFISLIIFFYINKKAELFKLRHILEILQKKGFHIYFLKKSNYEDQSIIDLYKNFLAKGNYTFYLYPWIAKGVYNQKNISITKLFCRTGKRIFFIFYFRFEKPLSFSIFLTKEDIIDKILNKDLQIGDKLFDQNIKIKGNNLEKIKDLLSNKKLREEIIKIFKSSSYGYIDQNELYFEFPDFYVENEKELDMILNSIAEIADILESNNN